jgi:hypothetical protein
MEQRLKSPHDGNEALCFPSNEILGLYLIATLLNMCWQINLEFLLVGYVQGSLTLLGKRPLGQMITKIQIITIEMLIICVKSVNRL